MYDLAIVSIAIILNYIQYNSTQKMSWIESTRQFNNILDSLRLKDESIPYNIITILLLFNSKWGTWFHFKYIWLTYEPLLHTIHFIFNIEDSKWVKFASNFFHFSYICNSNWANFWFNLFQVKNIGPTQVNIYI